METKSKRSVIVGLFVFAALVIFVLGVLTLGGQRSIFNRGAVITAVFDEVNGLQPGNNVWFSGVKVGTIKAINLTPAGKVAVQLNIEEKAQSLIKTDTRAKVGADGFIGNKIVVLSGGSPAAPVIQNGSTIGVERAIGTDEMMATLQENNKNILAITSNFKTLSEAMLQGKGSIGKLLTDDKMAIDMQTAVGTIKSAAANAEQLAANVSNYTARLTAKGSLTNDLITDTVLFSRLKSTVRQLDALSTNAGVLIDNLSDAGKNVSQSLSDKNTSLGLLLNDKQTAADIRATFSNLQGSTQKLNENMEALQHNFLLRGFFKKRDKQREKDSLLMK